MRPAGGPRILLLGALCVLPSRTEMVKGSAAPIRSAHRLTLPSPEPLLLLLERLLVFTFILVCFWSCPQLGAAVEMWTFSFLWRSVWRDLCQCSFTGFAGGSCGCSEETWAHLSHTTATCVKKRRRQQQQNFGFEKNQ